MLLESLRNAGEYDQFVHDFMLFIIRPLIRFSCFSRRGDSQETVFTHCQQVFPRHPRTPQIFRPTGQYDSFLTASPRYLIHKFHLISGETFRSCAKLCQWPSNCRLFICPVADSVRQVTRSLPPNMTTRANNGALIDCVMMCLGPAWIAKRP